MERGEGGALSAHLVVTTGSICVTGIDMCACMRACVRVCVRACICVCILSMLNQPRHYNVCM